MLRRIVTAQCWAHVLGIPLLVEDGAQIPDPLGTCFGCYAFTCAGHAEMDQGAWKWLCFQCVTYTVATSAGIGKTMKTRRLTSHVEFVQRFPIAAGATRYQRHAALDLLTLRGITPERGSRRLLADAVGIAHALMQDEATVGLHAAYRLDIDHPSVGVSARDDFAATASVPVRNNSTLLFSGQFGEFLSNLAR
jgi:hypothetical protein